MLRGQPPLLALHLGQEAVDVLSAQVGQADVPEGGGQVVVGVDPVLSQSRGTAAGRRFRLGPVPEVLGDRERPPNLLTVGQTAPPGCPLALRRQALPISITLGSDDVSEPDGSDPPELRSHGGAHARDPQLACK